LAELCRDRGAGFARDAKIPHTFQPTLNAPFNDPDGESRLKAGHYVPLSDLREIQDERNSRY